MTHYQCFNVLRHSPVSTLQILALTVIVNCQYQMRSTASSQAEKHREDVGCESKRKLPRWSHCASVASSKMLHNSSGVISSWSHHPRMKGRSTPQDAPVKVAKILRALCERCLP